MKTAIIIVGIVALTPLALLCYFQIHQCNLANSLHSSDPVIKAEAIDELLKQSNGRVIIIDNLGDNEESRFLVSNWANIKNDNECKMALEIIEKNYFTIFEIYAEYNDLVNNKTSYWVSGPGFQKWNNHNILEIIACKGKNRMLYYYQKKRKIDTKIMNEILHLSAYTGDIETARFALLYGANINSKDETDMDSTPLHCAIESIEDNMVEFLLENGADVKAINDYGKTPLLELRTNFGCEHGDEKLIKFYSKMKRIISMIVAAGGDINAQDDDGKSLLHEAAQSSSSTILNHLLTFKNLNVNILDKNGKDPLFYAKYENEEILMEYIKSAKE